MSTPDLTPIIAVTALVLTGLALTVAVHRLLTLLGRASDRADEVMAERDAARHDHAEASAAAHHWARRARRAEADLTRLRTPDPVDHHHAQTPADTIMMAAITYADIT